MLPITTIESITKNVHIDILVDVGSSKELSHNHVESVVDNHRLTVDRRTSWNAHKVHLNHHVLIILSFFEEVYLF